MQNDFFDIESRLKDGCTSIEKYQFSGDESIRYISIPERITEIGAHAFFDCANLYRIDMYDRITDINDGAFKNCDKLSEINITRVPGGSLACLKDMLYECNQELKITIHYEDGDALLLFPYYLHDFDENTPARIVTQVTVGSGMHYRECVSRKEINYFEYDTAFNIEKSIDVCESAYKIALYRINYPYKLSMGLKVKYIEYLEANRLEIGRQIIDNVDMDKLELLLNCPIWNRESMAELIEMARTKGRMECVNVLMRCQKEKFGAVKKVFDF